MRFTLNPIWSEFKAFAFKGNMIDLAVAVVIGAAFSGVVNSLVKDIIMPSLSYVTTAASEVKKTAGHMGREVGLPLRPAQTQPAANQPAAATSASSAAPAPSAGPGQAPDAQPVAIDFSWKIGRIQIGHFIAELINFMLIAFAVFLLMVKMVGSVARNVVKSPSEPTTKECPECLSIIPFKARRCSQCTAVLTPNP
jgi:large conductance mechanosensitive channel